jgi:energy-converting hydrogenase B subunit D
MSHLIPWLTALLCLAMLAGAIVAIRGTSTSIAILASGLVSLVASILFLILASPDVAMTEAAIGSGLTTFLLFFVLGRVRSSESGEGNNHG